MPTLRRTNAMALFLILVIGSSLTMGALAIWCLQISGRPGTNSKGAISLSLVLGGFCLIGLGLAFSIRHETRPLNGLFGLFSLPLIIAALVLAILGWMECAKSPNKYRHGKGMAVSTVVAGGFVILFVLSAFVVGVVEGVTEAKHRVSSRRQIEAGLNSYLSPPTLKFESFGFIYHYPGPPWRQVDARTFGPGRLLALATSDPVFFTVACKCFAPGDPEEQRFADFSKLILQKETTDYQLVQDKTLRGEGFCETRSEARANFQGNEYYYVSKTIITNDTGYYLQTWGPLEKADLIRSASEKVWAGFEVVPRRTTKSL